MSRIKKKKVVLFPPFRNEIFCVLLCFWIISGINNYRKIKAVVFNWEKYMKNKGIYLYGKNKEGNISLYDKNNSAVGKEVLYSTPC